MATGPIDLPYEASAFGIGAIPIPGPPGPQGDPGPTPNLQIGTVTQGVTAAATITGTQANPLLNLQLPQGNTGSQGVPGQSSSLGIGTVTTVAAGNPATATITGTPPAQVLNLGIPVGAAGPLGPPGANGSRIWQGNGAPSNATGVDGDYYIDAVGLNWWGPKASGAWPASPAFSIVPPAGLPRRALLTRSANQSVGAWPVDISFQAVTALNVTGVWSAGQPTRIVVPAGVNYASIVCQVEVDGGATAGTLITEVYKNGAQLSPRSFNNSGRNTTSGSAVNVLTDATYQVPVVPGDYFTIQVNQSGLSANNIIASSLWAQVTFS